MMKAGNAGGHFGARAGQDGRRYPAGAECLEGGVSFRVWAPAVKRVTLVLEGGTADGARTGEHEMQAEADGYFHLLVEGAGAGTLYRFRLEGEDGLFADPASRFQPDGPEGPSLVVDPAAYRWQDTGWAGVERDDQVLYEMHFGTFTPEGTYAAAAEKLPLLRDIGITCLELMPVNEFLGKFGWGYDGVLPFAATRLYGEPDDLRRFIDRAHALGIGVIIDVVYNHFGNGNRYESFTPDYFTDRYANEWGKSINFDGPNAQGVRDFVTANAAFWIDEYHFDGLRVDATQALYDSSKRHVMADMNAAVRAAAGGRSTYIVAENEPQDTGLVRPMDEAGMGFDALWNDDFHHSATVALTGRNDAYYHDHHGAPQEFVSAARFGYLYQGQRYDWQDGGRGKPGLDLSPAAFVHFLQNHDQIANSGTGLRMNAVASPARVRAMTALLLLGPQTPMLFQGQEFAASTPFFYFSDNSGEMADLVRNGRTDFLKQFPAMRDEAIISDMPDPADPQTVERAKLDWSEFDAHSHIVALHRDLLALRRDQPAFRQSARAGNRGRVDGSVLGPNAFLLRFFAEREEDERLLLVNFGSNLELRSVPDPLFAPPAGRQWQVSWSSEDPAYKGCGRRMMNFQARFLLQADMALVLEPARLEKRPQPDHDGMAAWQTEISC